ncbi:glycerol dehydrogenase [Choiromyces venosus 120613-1]|uniref:Glycerol dehydrogenase n=1 Tax=Choiromyces venosus 120613-1 TaxID=1336337 RepID=A0A3N4JKS5_9PEZI|nr:glycerol dehydrogenase [Choiromyces venosus 120613-1]
MSLGRTFTLPTGKQIPALGFGTFASEGSPGETYNAVLCALRTDYRHLDCAWFYNNESEIGSAIRDFLRERSDVRREDLFITTKVWNHLHEPDEMSWSFEQSLEKLGLEYVDLYLIHWPIAAERGEDWEPKIGPDGKYIIKKSLTEDPAPTWRAMEELYTAGRARAIGVSNWTIPRLQHLLKVEIHPFLPNTHLLGFCKANNILLCAYSPLGLQGQVPTTGERVSENPTLIEAASKGRHTLAQTLIAWGIKRGYAVIPKSGNPGRIASNFEDYEMGEEEFDMIKRVAEGRATRFVNMRNTFGYDVWANGEE